VATLKHISGLARACTEFRDGGALVVWSCVGPIPRGLLLPAWKKQAACATISSLTRVMYGVQSCCPRDHVAQCGSSTDQQDQARPIYASTTGGHNHHATATQQVLYCGRYDHSGVVAVPINLCVVGLPFMRRVPTTLP